MKKHIKAIITEINLLVGIMNKVEKARREHDAARNRISEAINKVMNGDWGNNDQCMKRGDLMAQLKTSETLLNTVYTDLLSIELGIDNNIGWMNKKIKEEYPKFAVVKTKKGMKVRKIKSHSIIK